MRVNNGILMLVMKHTLNMVKVSTSQFVLFSICPLTQGIVCNCSTITNYPACYSRTTEYVCLWRDIYISWFHLYNLYHYESWLCRPSRAARQSEGIVSYCGHDGTWLCHDFRNPPVFNGFCWCQKSFNEDRCYLQTLLRTGAKLHSFPLTLFIIITHFAIFYI